MKEFREVLKTKRFFAFSDAEVVIEIVQGYLLKRILHEAIAHKDVHELRLLLADLKGKNLQALIDEPIDAHLSTPLHCAVGLNFVDGVRELMQFGADAGIRKLQGDTPTQWFLLPRLSKAAW